ncbi:MAG: hypothetical protein B5M54_08060 [Candidatus Aminicenantes bacterium 4484_214]|nr:MAG: hypothetical protein B5M54_08060 [Candidatus Aminicenantes bacterium 4484_214]
MDIYYTKNLIYLLIINININISKIVAIVKLIKTLVSILIFMREGLGFSPPIYLRATSRGP